MESEARPAEQGIRPRGFLGDSSAGVRVREAPLLGSFLQNGDHSCSVNVIDSAT